MTYLIDTNVISELNKGSRCHPMVASWYKTATNDDLHLSVLVLGEIRKGIEQVRQRDRIRADFLERWLADIVLAFGDRILQSIARPRMLGGTWRRAEAFPSPTVCLRRRPTFLALRL